MSATPSVAYCPHCRARLGSAWRCLCGSWLPSAWLMTLGLVLGLVSVVCAGLLGGWAYAQVRDVYHGLGAAPPSAARLYFASAPALTWLAAGLVLLGPAAIAVIGRDVVATARLVRRYAALMVALAGWALSGAALWYHALRALAGALR